MFSFNHQYILQHRTSQPPGEKESYDMVKLTYPIQERSSYVSWMTFGEANQLVKYYATLITWPLLRVLLGELLSILEELLLVFGVLFCQVCPQGMLRFRGVHEGHQSLDHLAERDKPEFLLSIWSVFMFFFLLSTWSVLVAGFQFSADTIGKQTWQSNNWNFKISTDHELWYS